MEKFIQIFFVSFVCLSLFFMVREILITFGLVKRKNKKIQTPNETFRPQNGFY